VIKKGAKIYHNLVNRIITITHTIFDSEDIWKRNRGGLDMESLNSVVDIIKSLETLSSTKAKEHVLRKNADNKVLRKILYYTYSDMQYGIKKTSISKMNFPIDEDYKWENIYSMFEELAESNINNQLLEKVSNTIGYFGDKDIQDLLIRVLLKDLRIGMNVKSINKAIPNLIPTHEIMLASKFEGKLKGKVSMSLKMDGIRCSALVGNDGSIQFLSRQGHKILGLNEITDAIEKLGLKGYFIDGELIKINTDNIASDDNFRLTTKIVNSKADDKRGLEFVVFDITPIEDYYNGKSNLSYEQRLELMNELIGDGNKFVRLVEKFGITDNVEEVYQKLNEVVTNGKEGLILNTLSGVYSFGKRPKDILKVKAFSDADVLVVDILEGEGRLEGKLGKVKVQFKYEGKVYTSFVGSGFNDVEREYYWEHKDELINKVITIKYFEISKNEKDGVSFRFPTWQGKEYIRTDKQGIDDTNIE
jgi:DNA ligase-1